MNDSNWASFDVVYPDGEIQSFCCDLAEQSALDIVIDYLKSKNAKLIALRNFMANEINRLKEVRCQDGQSLFMEI